MDGFGSKALWVFYEEGSDVVVLISAFFSFWYKC